MEAADYLDLADWRRRVAELYARWRSISASDAERATREFRVARDALFKEHPQSPLPPEQRAAYPGVPYWDYDPAWRLTARLEPAEPAAAAASPFGDQALALPTSGDEAFNFKRIGRVTLGGPFGGATLSVFWMEGYAGGLFLPFRDATSGGETYGAGRYLLDTVKGADLGGNRVPASSCSTSTWPTTRRASTTHAGTARWRRSRTGWRGRPSGRAPRQIVIFL